MNFIEHSISYIVSSFLQGATEAGEHLMTTPADAPPSYIAAIHSQQYTPRTPSPLTFSVSATPLPTGGEAVAASLPPAYHDAVKQDEDK